MKSFALYDAKNRLSELCNQVTETGEPCVISRRGRPIVKIVPIADSECTDSVWDTVEEAKAKYGKLDGGFEPPERSTGGTPRPACLAMVTHLLDTTVYSQRLRRKPVAGVVRRWSALGDGKLAIATICEAELLYGLEKRNSNRLWTEYEHYLKHKLIVLPLDRKAIETYARIKAGLQGTGLTIGEFDLLIGATALANDLKLATLNRKHFAPIPGLQVEDWGS